MLNTAQQTQTPSLGDSDSIQHSHTVARHALGQEQERVDALELGQAGRADDGRLDRALRADVARRHARLLLEECASPAHRQSKQHTK